MMKSLRRKEMREEIKGEQKERLFGLYSYWTVVLGL
jgi:hypothetical protein